MPSWSDGTFEGSSPSNPNIVGAEYLTTPPSLANAATTPLLVGQRGSLRMQLMVPDLNATFQASTQADANGGIGLLPIANWYYNGSTFDRTRTPAVFKTVTATASGNTAAWTPAAGKKFRLMAYSFEVPDDAKAAAAADLTISLQDATTPVGMSSVVFIPSASGTSFGPDARTGWRTLGNGYLSAAANNVLNVNLSFALTAGVVCVNMIGTEE